MSENDIGDRSEVVGEYQEGDIIFDCPECQKSIAIDPRGAGLMITCPDCRERVQVPFPEEDELALEEALGSEEQLNEYADALSISQGKVREQMNTLEAVSKRRDFLEKMRVENMDALRVVKQEMVIIQDAVDRIASALQGIE